MSARVSVVLLALALCATLRASPREDLLFELDTALKTRDGAGFAHCFNFKDTDEATRKAFIDMIGKILAWLSFDVSTTDRRERGAPVFKQGGEEYTLNGEWQYQVHIFISPRNRHGFVFPAGPVDGGRDRILVPVPVGSKAAAR